MLCGGKVRYPDIERLSERACTREDTCALHDVTHGGGVAGLPAYRWKDCGQVSRKKKIVRIYHVRIYNSRENHELRI